MSVHQLVQRSTARSPTTGTRSPSVAPPIVHQALRSPGQPLAPFVRGVMEPRFGHDFSQVRVHTDAVAARSADAVNALAYTVGRDVIFARGQGNFRTPGGRHLLAHELAHTIQQQGSAPVGRMAQDYEIGRDDSPLEAEAERAADRIVRDAGGARRETVRPSVRAELSPILQRQSKGPVPETTVIQQDVPGELPGSYYAGPNFDAQIRIDGDGDQHKELVLHLSEKEFWPGPQPDQLGPVKKVNLQVTQISSGITKKADLALPKPRFGGQLFPLVEEVTDGRGPTRIRLVVNATDQILEIQPPERTPTGTSYQVSLLDQRFVLQFPPESSEIHRVAAVAAGPRIAGNIVFAEETLGAYGDRFGVTIRPLSLFKAQLGISSMLDGEPVDTDGAELAITGAVRFQIIDTGPTSFGIDLNGDYAADLTIYDRLTSPAEIDGGGPPDKNRNHRLRVTGSPIGTDRFFEFRVRDGRPVRGNPAPVGTAKSAASNALAVRTLLAQTGEGGFLEQLDAAEGQLVKVRQQAAENGVIQKTTFEAWVKLSNALIRAQPQMAQGVDPALQNEIAANAKAFFDTFARESAGAARRGASRVASTFYNPYTGESRMDNLASRPSSGAGPSLERDIRAGQWGKAMADYGELVAGFDRWIVAQLKAKRGEGGAREADRLATSKANLSDIERFQPKRILAVYHPDEKFKTEAGYSAEIPLSLYYWREGDTWRLKDLTNPSKTFGYTTSAQSNETQPPLRLLGLLNDPDHFPVGIIYYEIPGLYASTVNVSDYLTWKKFFAYLSLGLAAVGITLATAGSGTVAVVGAWALGASALLGAASAGIDLGEHIQQGNLDAGTAVLDLTQIVAGLSGAGSLAAGGIVRSAATATANARWAGAWARTAMLAGRVYLPITRTTAVADLITFAVVLPDTARQLEEIQKGKGSQTDKDHAKLLLLTQLAMMGGMTALSARGLIANPARMPTLVLHPGPEGVPVVSTAMTAESLVLDTNTVAAFELEELDAMGKIAKKDFHEGHRGRIAAIRAMTDADLRVADATISTEKGRRGRAVTQRGIGVLVDRASTEYQEFIKALGAGPFPVGGTKANAPVDREIFADVAFAAKEAGVIPRFATSDQVFYKALARRVELTPELIDRIRAGNKKFNPANKKYVDPQDLQKMGGVFGFFKDGFDVTINERTVHVIPLP